MDAEMPVLDGYSATREIRALGSTPIFLLTAHALREARDRSFAAGCTDHLTKPIKKATLLEAINKVVPVAIPVSVESWLKPVVGGYLEKRRGDVAKLREALDARRLRHHPHARPPDGRHRRRLRFRADHRNWQRARRSALASDAERIRTSIEDLDRYLNAVQVE